MPRFLAIGDIHGCYAALRALCESVDVSSEDTVITLGDYVNRGPNTNAVVDYLAHLDRSCHLVPICGNHDLMMLRARDSEDDLRKWLDMGGGSTLRSYAPFDGDSGMLSDVPDEHWEFLENRLQPYYETDSHFFVHANAYPDLPLSEQPDFMLFWEPFANPPRHESGKIMVCGHTSQKSGLPVVNENAICIDTWACGGAWLTCLDVGAGDIYQANENQETRRLRLVDLA